MAARHKVKISLLICLSFLLLNLVSGDVYQFNNCGAEGRTGPGSCSYSGSNNVDIIGNGIQVWDVPQTGEYRIEARGAQGGGPSDTGQGAVVEGEISLEEDETIRILVGQQGEGVAGEGVAGGGGTFVVTEDSSEWNHFDGEGIEPIVVAAGGQGDADNDPDGIAVGKATNTEDPSGGVANDNCRGSGGGGFDGEGGNADSLDGAPSFLSGGEGADDTCGDNNDGGFGSGGGGGSWSGYGGGGGFKGGEGVNRDFAGDPALSHWDEDFTTTTTIDGGNQGHGFVEIELLTDPDSPDIQTPFSPSKSQASSTSSPADMSFSVDVDIDDDGGVADDNTLDSCSVSATSQDNGGSVNPSTSITSSGSAGGTGTCEFDIENNDNSNWEPGETIEVEVSVEDSYDGTHTISREHVFENSDPETVDVSVDDGHIHDDYDGEVWGGENGVTLEVEVEDYESASTNTDVSVELDGGSIGSGSVSNGEGTFTSDWENQDSDMDGFDRGGSYGVDASAFDETGLNSGDSITFNILRESDVSDPAPVEGDSAEDMEIFIEENPVLDVDDDVSSVEVRFYIEDEIAGDFQLEDTDTISSQGQTASINIEDLDLEDPPGSWKFKIDNEYQTTNFRDSAYRDNTDPEAPYSFVTAEPPVILDDEQDAGPISEEEVAVDEELVMWVDDPDESQVNVTFWEGEPGTDYLGHNTIDTETNQRAEIQPEAFGDETGTEYSWSVTAEDMEFDSVETTESEEFIYTTVKDVEVEFLEIDEPVDHVEGDLDQGFEVEVTQDDENVDLAELEFTLDDDPVNQVRTVASQFDNDDNIDTSGPDPSDRETTVGSNEESDFSLDYNEFYSLNVYAALNETKYGEVSNTDSVTFQTIDDLEVTDVTPSPNQDNVGNYPEMDVTFEQDDGNEVEVTIEGQNATNEEWFAIHQETTTPGTVTVSSSELEQVVEEEDAVFANDPLEEEYNWRVTLEDTEADIDAVENEYVFFPDDILQAEVDVEFGSHRNVNPETALYEGGRTDLEIQVSSVDTDSDMGAVEFYLDGETDPFYTAGETDNDNADIMDGETVSGDTAGADLDEDGVYEWSVEVYSPSGNQLDTIYNNVEDEDLKFTTNTAEILWDSASEDYYNFRIYHQTPEGFQEATTLELSDVDEGAVYYEVDIADEWLGHHGVESCYQVSLLNIAGEGPIEPENPEGGDSCIEHAEVATTE